jgi:hypothetical protein
MPRRRAVLQQRRGMWRHAMSPFLDPFPRGSNVEFLLKRTKCKNYTQVAGKVYFDRTYDVLTTFCNEMKR